MAPPLGWVEDDFSLLIDLLRIALARIRRALFYSTTTLASEWRSVAWIGVLWTRLRVAHDLATGCSFILVLSMCDFDSFESTLEHYNCNGQCEIQSFALDLQVARKNWFIMLDWFERQWAHWMCCYLYLKKCSVLSLSLPMSFSCGASSRIGILAIQQW